MQEMSCQESARQVNVWRLNAYHDRAFAALPARVPSTASAWWSGFDVRYSGGRHALCERQIQSSTRINNFWWSFDSNIRKSDRCDGMRMLGSDHQSTPSRDRRNTIEHLGNAPPRPIGGALRQRVCRKEAAGHDLTVGLGHVVLAEPPDDIDGDMIPPGDM